MRSVLLVVFTLVVVGAGFGVYWALYGGGNVADGEANGAGIKPGEARLPTTMNTLVGPGEIVWWERFDKDTGKRASRLRADRYEPMPDGRVSVINPIAEFFSYSDEKDEAGNEIIEVTRVVGRRGIVTMEEGFRSNQGGIAGGTPSQTPRSGDLFDVTLYTYPTAADAEKDTVEFLRTGAESPNATMMLVTHNCSFDSETFRVATEPYIDDDGLTVPADRVKVTVRGEDYEFDGYGLQLQYNQRDKRLEYLRIAHGERLRVKRPGPLMNARKGAEAKRPDGVGWTPSIPLYDVALVDAGDSMWRSMLAQTVWGQVRADAQPAQGRRRGGGRRGNVVAATQPTTRPKPAAPVYRATFKDQVKVMQGGEVIALGNLLQVDFIEGGSDDEDENAAQTQPAQRQLPALVENANPESAAARPAALPTAGSIAAPTTRPSVANRADRRRTPGGASRRDRVEPATGTETAEATTQPSTRRAEQPLDIFWSGALEVVPLRTPRPERVAPGESIVRLQGDSSRPAELFRTSEGVKSHIKCATLIYWTLDGGVLLEEGDGVAVSVKDTRGTDILTHRMLFSEADGTAVLYGPSRARLPLEGEKPVEARGPDGSVAAAPTTRPAVMDVAWTEECTLLLLGGGLEQMVVRQADLVGGVRVQHPDMTLASRQLSLFFVPEEEQAKQAAEGATKPTTRPSREMPPLKEMHAVGDVICVIRGDGGDADVRTFKTDDLRLLTARNAEGKLFARSIHAVGQVDAQDPKQRMTTDQVTVVLKEPKPKPTTQPAEANAVAVAQPEPAPAPTTKPSKQSGFEAGDLETLDARGNVRVVTVDGKTVEGVRLVIDGRGEEAIMTVFGEPIAKVTDRENVLTGPSVVMKSKSQEIIVDGPGKLVGFQSDPKEPAEAAATTRPTTRPARPIEATWQRSFRAEGRNNLAEFLGDVTVTSTDEDGTVNTGAGQRIMLVMMPKPTTRPTTQPAGVASATTKPTTDFDALGGRAIKSIIIQDAAVVDSNLFDANNVPLKMFHVDSELIHYDREQQKLNIPQAGQMLILDERPPSTQPVAQEAAKDPLGVKGRMAFKWARSLVYDEGKNQIVFNGNVAVSRVAQQEGQAPPDPMNLNAERVVADLVPAPVPTTQPVAAGATTQPTTRRARPSGLAAMGPKMQLKGLTAEAAPDGTVRVTSRQINVQAQRIHFDPVKHVLTVEENRPGRRAVKFDSATNLPDATFRKLVWNTETGNILETSDWQVQSRK